MYVLRMYGAQPYGESGKMFPACFYTSFKSSGNDAAILNMAIGKSMQHRDFSAGGISKTEAKKQNKKEQAEPAKIFFLKPLLEEKPILEEKPKSVYRPAA